MRVVKNLIKSVTSKNGETLKYYQVMSEHNEKNKGKLKNERFDIKFSEVKKLIDSLKLKGKKFLINGLNKRSWTNITNLDGKIIYQDEDDYLEGKEADAKHFDAFAQLTVIVFE